MSEKRLIEITFDKNSNLSIRIECEHGSLFAMNWNSCDDLIGTRYMANELIADKRIADVFDVSFVEEKDEAI